MNEILVGFLNKDLEQLEASEAMLRRSYEICAPIGLKAKYSLEELDALEAYTSRFSRLADLLVLRLFRLIDELDLETSGTVRDRINRAEKKGLIESAALFIDMRLLRNEIAHEHSFDVVTRILDGVYEMTGPLLRAVQETRSYTKKFLV